MLIWPTAGRSSPALANEAARGFDVPAVSGASSLPCFSAAVIDFFLPELGCLESVDYGISAAQQTGRGLATTASVFSYVGKPMKALRKARTATVYCWQDTQKVRYPVIGARLFGNCDVPDLELFPHAIRSSGTFASAPGTSSGSCEQIGLAKHRLHLPIHFCSQSMIWKRGRDFVAAKMNVG